MPGIPRKPYCQPCKRRRVKCDEKWPTCSACARAGIVCPGPSGMKFVLNNNHKAGREEALVYSSKPNKRTNGSSSASSGNLVLAERPATTAVQTAGYNSEFRSYRLLNAWDYRVPMTSSDQLSARLVALMEATPQLVSSGFRCLREIPRRLHLSECLQDSIRYWCSSWIDHHQGLRVPSNMSHYCQGKAIRSLLRAIQGSQVPSIETAAAATALYRTSELFNPNKSSRESRLLEQAAGIATLVRLRGIPNMDDPFDVLLMYEQLGIIEPLRAYTGSHEARFCDTPAWQEVRQKVIEKVTLDEGGQEIDLYINNYVTAHGDAAKDIKLCREDPISFCDKAERIEREMRQFLFNLEALFPGHWAYAEKVSGTIIETPDPDFFLGRKYLLKSRKTFDILSEALYASFAASLMISRIRRLYDKPVDLDIQKKYRECCERYWMFIPHLRTLDPLTLSDEIVMYMFTIEAANEQETEHLVEFIGHMDVVKEYPSDYDGTLEEIKSIVDLVVGGRSEIETREPEPATEFFEG